MGLSMFGSHVLCNHMWLWGEGCDFQGCPGSRALRAASEKQNDGARGGEGSLVLSGSNSLNCSFIPS